jgi:potassium-transporting ATPase KdpC subunit
MNRAARNDWILPQLITSVRMVIVTMAVCCVLYPLAILGTGLTVRPFSADGSLIRNKEGTIVGSELLAQGFTRPEYFWPRPSAVMYDASASGGSNLSPANPELRRRADTIVAKMNVTFGNPLPADLATASGSGLDPHITLAAAKYQAQRVAESRGLSIDTVMGLLERYARHPGGVFTPEPVVNVLLVNMALDEQGK